MMGTEAESRGAAGYFAAAGMMDIVAVAPAAVGHLLHLGPDRSMWKMMGRQVEEAATKLLLLLG
jgi:hypothetical protein